MGLPDEPDEFYLRRASSRESDLTEEGSDVATTPISDESREPDESDESGVATTPTSDESDSADFSKGFAKRCSLGCMHGFESNQRMLK